MLFTVGVLGQEEAVLYEYEDYDFECPDEYLGYFPHLFRYGHQEVERQPVFSSAANRLIGEVVQSRRRPLLGPSPG